MSLALSRRARVTQTDLTRRKHYRTADGRAEIVEVRWLHPLAYGVYWLAIIHVPKLTIRRHRTKAAAIRTIERAGR